MRFQKNKRAASFDNIYILVSFFALVLFALVGMVMWNSLTTDEINEDVWDKTAVGTSAKEHANRFYDNLDTIILMVYVALHLGILVLAFVLRTHPVVYIAAIFLIVLIAILGAVFGNVWESITADEDFISAAQSFPKINLIMNNFPKFEIIWAFLTSIALFGLARSEGFV